MPPPGRERKPDLAVNASSRAGRCVHRTACATNAVAASASGRPVEIVGTGSVDIAWWTDAATSLPSQTACDAAGFEALDVRLPDTCPRSGRTPDEITLDQEGLSEHYSPYGSGPKQLWCSRRSTAVAWAGERKVKRSTASVASGRGRAKQARFAGAGTTYCEGSWRRPLASTGTPRRSRCRPCRLPSRSYWLSARSWRRLWARHFRTGVSSRDGIVGVNARVASRDPAPATIRSAGETRRSPRE